MWIPDSSLHFFSESPRNRTAPISPHTWVEIVEDMADRTGPPRLTAHPIRHLCFTCFARARAWIHTRSLLWPATACCAPPYLHPPTSRGAWDSASFKG